MTSAIATVETAYEELLQTAKVVLNDYHRISESENHYRGKYCYPFFTQGSYYVERDNYRTNEHCFMPMPLDDDMRKFVEALRKLDQAVRPLFGWDIRSEYPREDEGNVLVDECDGCCYLGHNYQTIETESHRKFGVLVGVICYGVYKDAFLDEILEKIKKTRKSITKTEFRSIQGFSR